MMIGPLIHMHWSATIITMPDHDFDFIVQMLNPVLNN